MKYVLVVKRVVKTDTGATERYAPKTRNEQRTTVSGPFLSQKAVMRSLGAALTTHTCIEAVVMTEAEIAAHVGRSSGYYTNDDWKTYKRAEAMFKAWDDAHAAAKE